MRKIDKIYRNNPNALIAIMQQIGAWSTQHLCDMCSSEDDTALFLEFLTTQDEHNKLLQYLGNRCYCNFGDGQLECGRDDLPQPLWCINWLTNRTQAYKAVIKLRKLGITGEISLVKGIDCIPIMTF